MVRVIELKPLDGFRLWLRFSDGSEGVRDMSGLVTKPGVMLEPLRDEAFFKQVSLDMGAPTWANGYDLDPIKLYMELRDANGLSRTAAE